MDLVVDILLVACLVLTAIAGARNGFFRELFSLAGLAAGVALGLRLTTPILERAPEWMRRSGAVWGVLFALLLVVIYAGLSLAGRALAVAWEGKKPTGLSRLLGFVLGATRGLALVICLATAMIMLGPPERGPLARSRVLPRLDAALRAAAAVTLPPPARAKVLERWDRLPFRRVAGPESHSPKGGAAV